jgi:uncharacterized protein
MTTKTLEALGREECEALLAAHHVGRLAVMVDDQPHIVPVNYAVDHSTIVFRTADGTVLTEAALRKVAFEVDGVDERTRTGWSVCVHGYGREIGDAVDADSRRLAALPVETWAPGERGRVFKIVAGEVTGRFIGRRDG